VILFWVVALLSIGSVLLGSIWHNLSQYIGAFPNLSLVLLVLFSIRRGAGYGPWLGLIIGITFDFTSSLPLGFTVFPMVVLGYIFGQTRGKISLDPILMPFALVLAASLLVGLIESLLGSIFGISLGFVRFARMDFWLETLYNGLIAPLFLILMDSLIRLFIKPFQDKSF